MSALHAFPELMASLQQPDSETPTASLVGVVNIVFEAWRPLALSALAFGLVAGSLSLFIEPQFVSTAAFVPQVSGDASKAGGLAGLAGQLGVSIPSGSQTQSPEFYVRLLKSRVLLEQIARDSFATSPGQPRRPFGELFRIPARSPEQRIDRSVDHLRRIVNPSLVKLTGIVEIGVTTPWPTVSQTILADLLGSVDAFNVALRRAQAAAEREFVEKRLVFARDSLRHAENRMQRFLVVNRQISNSPELTFERERLQRELSLAEQVFTTLTQSYEEVRLREVRDTPVISVLEPPAQASEPKSRYRVIIVLAAMTFGVLLALTVTIISRSLRARSAKGEPSAVTLTAHLAGIRRRSPPSARAS